jgi:hypothetical protein
MRRWSRSSFLLFAPLIIGALAWGFPPAGLRGFALRQAHATSATGPVVVELFTSEGCSSCPPADRLLTELAQAKVAGVTVIPLGLHVDYWNDGGWHDRFSSHSYTERQEQYGHDFHLDSVYTPQAVIDGRFQAVGNQRGEILEYIRRAAGEPKPVKIELSPATTESGTVALRIKATAPTPVKARLVLAITEDQLSTEVKGGENGGHILHHSAVVRLLTYLTPAAAQTFESISMEWNDHPRFEKREALHAVVIAQGDDGRILGAATASLR